LHGIGDTVGTVRGTDGDIALIIAGDGTVLHIMVDTTTTTGEEIITITTGLTGIKTTIVMEEEPQQVLHEVVVFQEV